MIFASLKHFVARHAAVIAGFLLALATAITYGRVGGFEFVNYDDPFMICNNPFVNQGWTAQGFLWGLTTSYHEYWHPITWWSHMTDCELFGLAAGRHHLVSVGFHIINSLLLFVILWQLTGRMILSVVVAALFALHPMHVESVAWIAERKDLLSTLFWLLSVWAYAFYVRKVPAKNPRTKLFYCLSLVFFACGLMSKPMVVTLPFVLLLLDYWPLNRFRMESIQLDTSPLSKEPSFSDVKPKTEFQILVRLVKEKIPFFGLTVISCVITFWDAQASNSIVPSNIFPWSFRLANIPVSYARYLLKLVWPVDMVALYPLPERWTFSQIGLSVLIILGITTLAIRLARSAPYLIFGWLMFLGTLFPTLSLVPVGYQSIADRDTYVPYIGLFVALVWLVAEGTASLNSRFRQIAIGGITSLLLVVSGFLSGVQAEYWRNDFVLWSHCLAVTQRNFPAEYNLALAFQNAGKFSEAAVHYQKAVQIRPDHGEANLNLGRALAVTGRMQEATNYFVKATEILPDSADAHGNLGLALFDLDDFSGAVAESAKAIELNPNDFRSLLYLGRGLSAQNKSDQAMEIYARGARLHPDRGEIYHYMGVELLKRGELNEAIASLSEAVRLMPTFVQAQDQLNLALDTRTNRETIARLRDALRQNPDSFEAANNLAWLLATAAEPELRDGSEAIKFAGHACTITAYKEVVPIGTLAAAYAEAAQFEKAVATSQRACNLATALGQTNLLERNKGLLEEFKKSQPHHESLGTTSN